MAVAAVLLDSSKPSSLAIIELPSEMACVDEGPEEVPGGNPAGTEITCTSGVSAWGGSLEPGSLGEGDFWPKAEQRVRKNSREVKNFFMRKEE